MSKRKKAAKRSTARRTQAKRSPARRVSATSRTMEMFEPSRWVSTLLGSQTGRKIVAEALVAAAAAAAGVIVASRTEAGQRAGRKLMSVSKRSGEIAKEAALSAAAAAADVITETATEALHTASKSLLSTAREADMDESMADRAGRARDRRAH